MHFSIYIFFVSVPQLIIEFCCIYDQKSAMSSKLGWIFFILLHL